VCVCVVYVFSSDGVSGRKRRGVAVVECHLRTKVRSRLVRWRGLMVAVAAAVGLLYGVYAIEFSTGEFWNEKERSIGMLAFLFIPNDIGYTCYVMNVFRWKGGSPPPTATVMVVLFLVGISMEIHVDSCTVQGYYREN